jgi:hypothetical protein
MNSNSKYATNNKVKAQEVVWQYAEAMKDKGEKVFKPQQK